MRLPAEEEAARGYGDQGSRASVYKHKKIGDDMRFSLIWMCVFCFAQTDLHLSPATNGNTSDRFRLQRRMRKSARGEQGDHFSFQQTVASPTSLKGVVQGMLGLAVRLLRGTSFATWGKILAKICTHTHHAHTHTTHTHTHNTHTHNTHTHTHTHTPHTHRHQHTPNNTTYVNSLSLSLSVP